MIHHVIGGYTVKNKFDVLSGLEIMKYVQYPIHLHSFSVCTWQCAPLTQVEIPSLHSLPCLALLFSVSLSSSLPSQ